ncbi:hypothetical protein HDV06_001162 [Boothiomyces sp. JEL0866]|nr:hypothetical protein HDV06_001162 [Boothiomyces sp. JEL0866]
MDTENKCTSCVLRTKFKLNGEVIHVVQTEDEQLDDNYLLLGSREHIQAIEASISNVQSKIKTLQGRIATGQVDQLQLENCIAKLQVCEAKQLEELDFLRENCAPVVENPSSSGSETSYDDDTLNRTAIDFESEEILSITDTSEETIHVTSTTFGAIKKLEIIEIKKREGLYVPPVIRQYFKNGVLHRENEHMHVAWVELFIDLIYVDLELVRLSFNLDIEHFTERHGLLIVIVLGEIVVNIQKDFSNAYPGSFIGLTIVTFLMAYNIYYIYFRAEIGDHSKHALRRSKYTGLLWGAIHVLLALTMVSLAKCLSGLLSDATSSYIISNYESHFNYEFQTLYSGSLAMIYIMIAVLSLCHLDKSEVSHASKKKIKFIRNLSKTSLVAARMVVGLVFLILGLTITMSSANWIYLGGGLTTFSLFLEEYGRLKQKKH